MPELAISTDKVAFLIEKAREFDVKEGVSDAESGSNAADDKMIDVLEDTGQDPVVQEITGFINAMTEEEQIDLVALMRLGRGDGSIEEWDDLRREAAEGRNNRTASRCSAIIWPRVSTHSVCRGPTSEPPRSPDPHGGATTGRWR
jgi:hypothetical protein